MSKLNIEPLADAARALRDQINQALDDFDKATGGAVRLDVSVDAFEVTTVSDATRVYKHCVEVRSGLVEII